jgi:Spy/CpxP family protein refolding chaperone
LADSLPLDRRSRVLIDEGNERSNRPIRFGTFAKENSMKLSKLKLWIGAMALVLPASMGFAQDAPPAGHMFHGGHELRFLSEHLNLSDAQKTQIKQLLTTERPAFHSIMQQGEVSRQQMTALVQGGNFDETKAQVIAASEAQTMAQMTVLKAKTDAAIFELLTPEQRTTLAQLTAERQRHFAEHMQRQPGDQAQQPTN